MSNSENSQTDDILGAGGIISGDTKREVRLLQGLLVVLSVATWIMIMLWASSQMMARARYGIVFLGLMILIYVLSELVTSVDEGKRLDSVILTGLGLVTIVSTIYLFIEYLPLIRVRVGYAYGHEYVISFGMAVVIGYLTYRKYGLAFFLVFMAAIVYGLTGQHIPGVFGHSGFSYERLLQILVTDIRGFYGSLNQIVAAWIALFLLYAGLLRGYGAFDLIIRVSFRAADFVKSGVAQSAVIASMIIGSVNGSAAANAAMTGSFTIPLMKKSGMRGESAAGIESVASSGGQMLPPVMGAGAFVMASLLGITYWEVMTAAVVPALIFLIAVAIAVHYTAVNQIGDVTLDVSNHVDKMKNRNQLIWEGIRFIIPLSLLIIILGYFNWTVMTAALYTVVAMMLTGMLFPVLETLKSGDVTVQETVKTQLHNTLSGFVYDAEILAPIAIIVAAINAVVDIFQTTGVPASLSLALIDLSGGSMLVAVLLAMIICIILGLGMPTVAAYTIVAILIAPTLIDMFLLPDLAVHFFVFYAAVLSGLTPPIAIAVVVASGVAGSNFWSTCVEALKIAAPLYVLPIVFVYNSELIVGGFGVEALISMVLTIGGAVSIVHGLNYVGQVFDANRSLDYGVRFVFVVLGVLAMVYPGTLIRVGVVGAVVLLIAMQTHHAKSTIVADHA